MIIIGIDDAGRGPVIGPMALAGVLLSEELEKEFREHGIKDSKQLTPKKREQLAAIIKEKAKSFHITLTSASDIDARAGNGTNLNDLEAIESAHIINKLNTGKEIIKVVIDCPSTNIKSWIEYVTKHVENKDNLEIIGEHKADINHVAVSAASILAKTTRDAEIEKIKKKIGIDFGSGYPSDPATCEFLKNYSEQFKDDGIFRKTWGTWKNMCSGKKQQRLGEF